MERLNSVLLKETKVIVFLAVAVVEGSVVALVAGEELSIPLRHGCPEWKEYVRKGQQFLDRRTDPKSRGCSFEPEVQSASRSRFGTSSYVRERGKQWYATVDKNNLEGVNY